MTIISLEDIQRDPESFLDRVVAGETLTVVRAGQPVAEIKPITAEPKRSRPLGLATGTFTVPDDFDAPLPEDVLDAFEHR